MSRGHGVPAAPVWNLQPSSLSITSGLYGQSAIYAAPVAPISTRAVKRTPDLVSKSSEIPRPQAPRLGMGVAATILHNDQFSHGELVKNHNKMSDLPEGGQIYLRSGLETEMPTSHDHELERVQRFVVPTSSRDTKTDVVIRSSLHMQCTAQPPAMDRQDVHYKSQKPYSIPSTSNWPPCLSVAHSVATAAPFNQNQRNHKSSHATLHHPYHGHPVHGSNHTTPYAYESHPVQGIPQSSSLSGWQGDLVNNNSVPGISPEADLFRSEVPQQQGFSEYISPRERAYQPPPGVSIEFYRSHDYHVHHCPEGSLCASIPSLPPK